MAAAAALGTACRSVSAAAPLAPPQASPSPGAEAAAFASFDRAIGEYMAVHARASGTVAPARDGASADAVISRQRALAEAIRALRTGARQGQVFSPDAAPAIRRIVAEELRRHPVEAHRDGQAGGAPRLTVNGDYPQTAAAASVPSPLLLRLPRLPKELEYRFVGRHLVVRDVGANMVVDFLPDALPAS